MVATALLCTKLVRQLIVETDMQCLESFGPFSSIRATLGMQSQCYSPGPSGILDALVSITRCQIVQLLNREIHYGYVHACPTELVIHYAVCSDTLCCVQ